MGGFYDIFFYEGEVHNWNNFIRETFINQIFCLKLTGVWFRQVKFTEIYYIKQVSFKVQFIKDSCLFEVCGLDRFH